MFCPVTVTPAGEQVEVERQIPRTHLPWATRDALGRKRLDAITSVEELCRGGAVVGYEVRHANAWRGDRAPRTATWEVRSGTSRRNSTRSCPTARGSR